MTYQEKLKIMAKERGMSLEELLALLLEGTKTPFSARNLFNETNQYGSSTDWGLGPHSQHGLFVILLDESGQPIASVASSEPHMKWERVNDVFQKKSGIPLPVATTAASAQTVALRGESEPRKVTPSLVNQSLRLPSRGAASRGKFKQRAGSVDDFLRDREGIEPR